MTTMPHPGRHRRSDPAKEKFWRKTLRGFAASGQGVRAFCAARGLTEPSFYAWRRTIAQRGRKSVAPALKRPTFVELRPPHARGNGDAPLELLAGNRRLLIRRGCDAALLRQVLAALEA